MIILLQGTNVKSYPAFVQQGSGSEQVQVITPPTTAQLVLKVTPPSQEAIEDIPLTKVFGDKTTEGNAIYTATLPSEVTEYFGTAKYSVCKVTDDGTISYSETGTFSVKKGILVDMPTSVEDLAQKSIDQIYAILAEYASKAQEVQDTKEKIGIESDGSWTELNPDFKSETLIGAINKELELRNQADIGLQTDINKKLTRDEDTSGVLRVYAVKSDGSQTSIDVGDSSTTWKFTIPIRNTNGQIKVNSANNPTDNDDVTSKKYVDNQISTKIADASANVRRSYTLSDMDALKAYIDDETATGTSGLPKHASLLNGDSLYLLATSVPDFWFVKDTTASKGTHKYDDYNLDIDGIGYFAMLDSDHGYVDKQLTKYYTKNEITELLQESVGDAMEGSY